MIASLLRTVLEKRGYSVKTAVTAEYAVDAVASASEPFDLAVIAYLMPSLSGAQCLALLREKQPDLKALFITGHDLSEAEANMPRCRLLYKPFAVAEIGQIVREMIASD